MILKSLFSYNLMILKLIFLCSNQEKNPNHDPDLLNKIKRLLCVLNAEVLSAWSILNCFLKWVVLH